MRPGQQWSDPAMVAAYGARAPYSDALLRRVIRLLQGVDWILDIGAGTGDIARPLARAGLMVDAVEPSAAMVARGRRLEGGARVNWLQDTAEKAALAGPYGLAVAGDSVQWLDLDRALPRIRNALHPDAWLVVASRGEGVPACWPELEPLVAAYSTHRERAPIKPIRLLEDSGWFRQRGHWIDESRTLGVPVEVYLRSLHSRDGLGPAHMGEERVAAFDAAARLVLERAAPAGYITIEVAARVAWGRIR